MNASTYDRIIEKYFEGAMSPAEEHEFRSLMQADTDLQRLYDAELAVRRTLESDAESVPVETDRSYTRFMAALAATAPASSPSDSGATSTVPAPSGSGWIPAGFLKLAGATVVTLGIAAAGYFALVDRDAEPAAVRSTAGSPVSGPTTIDARSGDRQPSPAATTRDAESKTDDDRPTTHLRERGATHDVVVGTKKMTTAPATNATPIVDPHDDISEITDRNRDEDLPIIESDTVSARVNVRLGSGR